MGLEKELKLVEIADKYWDAELNGDEKAMKYWKAKMDEINPDGATN